MNKNIAPTVTEPLEWETCMMLLDALKGSGDYKNLMLCSISFFMGLRVSDTRSIRWCDILGDKLILHETKTKKRRTIHFDQKFIEIRDFVIDQYEEKPSGYIFRYERTGAANKPMSVQAINLRIKKIFKRYGIKGKASSHCFRKSFCKRIYSLNPSTHTLVLLSKLLNHSSTMITRAYIGLTNDEIKNCYLSLSSGTPVYYKAS